MKFDPYLVNFVRESNMIEGIMRPPTSKELEAHMLFLELSTITLDDVCALVRVLQPDAELRDKPGLNVRVGSHLPMSGGPLVSLALLALLQDVKRRDPYTLHCEYETLHPFTDGNGRSGRAIWLWMMKYRRGTFPMLGFLHSFYYQTLEHCDARRGGNNTLTTGK